MKNKKEEKKEEETYEGNLKKFEDIVNQLENGNLRLDDSLGLYKDGLELSKKLQKELDEFKGKLMALQEDENFKDFNLPEES